MNLRTGASRAVLAAYTGSEQQSYRPPTKMKTQCGHHIVTINPYIQNKRYKCYGEVCANFDRKVEGLSTQIDTVHLISSEADIETSK